METNALANLLRAIADLVDAPDPQNLARLTEQLSSAKSNTLQMSKHKNASNEKLSILEKARDELLEAKTREGGYLILNKYNLNKKDLTDIARSSQVYVSKDDNTQLIKDKLVETIVGSRLNSRAIRGFDE